MHILGEEALSLSNVITKGKAEEDYRFVVVSEHETTALIVWPPWKKIRFIPFLQVIFIFDAPPLQICSSLPDY